MLTYKEFTDEEITKAVECCSEPCCVCDECPLYCVGVNCSSFELHRYALDLINRQKSEIERLRGSTIVNNIMESQRIKREAKAEAVKEFAEKLKEKSFKTIRNYGLTKDVVEVSTINNLLKEMVGDDNA